MQLSFSREYSRIRLYTALVALKQARELTEIATLKFQRTHHLNDDAQNLVQTVNLTIATLIMPWQTYGSDTNMLSL